MNKTKNINSSIMDRRKDFDENQRRDCQKYDNKYIISHNLQVAHKQNP